VSSETSRSTAATGKAYRALKELVRAAPATLSAALATAPEPWPCPCPCLCPCPCPTTLTPTQVEQQCNDPQLMHCGLEKCVAADGSVEWVAAHSKVRLDPHLPPIALSHTAPVPNARVADLSHPPAGTLPARGRQVPHLEPARPGSLFELELAGIKRRAEMTRDWARAGLQCANIPQRLPCKLLRVCDSVLFGCYS
jgi:hypothetical protein